MKARYTRSQKQIIQVLKSLNHDISAQDLYAELKNRDQPLGLATVYRALEALKGKGMIKARTLSSGEALYSLTSEDKHHLNCVNCGRSFTIDGCPIRDFEEILQQSHHFQVYYHTLEFFGKCYQCQTKSAL
ncbi:Fur family transcriptional regulator [Crocosphaera sp. Alani8]|uniref:Fur family transcriptional regulator n=1 Tax=Crocosphaera sp. Alani8 TaxID=3038952 RepID=UPI00313CDC44